LKKIGLKIILGGMIIVPLVLVILPSTFFDEGQAICLSVLLFDRECLGCGMTRATQHMIHCDFSGAYAFNKLSFLVLPVLIYLYVKQFFIFWKKVKEM
jgi:hypothetical protein